MRVIDRKDLERVIKKFGLSYFEVVMCKRYEHSYLWLDGKLKAVDRCIASFILQLHQAGIKACNSGCGHGRDYPCIIFEPGTEEKLKGFGCKMIETRREDGHVFAHFPVNSETGKVYVEELLIPT